MRVFVLSFNYAIFQLAFFFLKGEPQITDCSTINFNVLITFLRWGQEESLDALTLLFCKENSCVSERELGSLEITEPISR